MAEGSLLGSVSCIWHEHITSLNLCLGFNSGKEFGCQCRRDKRCRFDPWVRKIPWKRAWQPILVFLPGESPWTEEPGRLQSVRCKKLDMAEWLTLSLFTTEENQITWINKCWNLKFNRIFFRKDMTLFTECAPCLYEIVANQSQNKAINFQGENVL